MTILAQGESNNEEEEREKVIVFIQKSKESEFTVKEILKLQSYIKDLGIPIKIVDIDRSGAPEEVKYTPFIVYQNYLGRKIYKGRYTTFRRLKNFINTVQYIPSDAGEYTVSNALVWTEGRSEFFVQSKITPLKGQIPGNFNPAVFMNDAWTGIKKGMSDFEFHNHKNFLLANEIFYLNYYPFAGKDGRLYVSFELFSHYDCITPIYAGTEAVKSSFFNVSGAFSQASKKLSSEMMKLWKTSELGDAISSVSKDIRTVTWDQLGFFIPPPPKKKVNQLSITESIKFTKKWNYKRPFSEDKAALQFYFPPPIHQYSGFVPEIKGGLTFEHADSFLISSLKGEFEVGTGSLTMGLEDLDSAVHTKMLKVNDFPKATFKILKVRAKKGATVSLGKPTYTQVEAAFSLMDKLIIVKAPTQFEPHLDDDGKLLMHIKSSFKIENIAENYNLEGPPGPPKASNNVIVKIDLLLEPTILNN